MAQRTGSGWRSCQAKVALCKSRTVSIGDYEAAQSPGPELGADVRALLSGIAYLNALLNVHVGVSVNSLRERRSSGRAGN